MCPNKNGSCCPWMEGECNCQCMCVEYNAVRALALAEAVEAVGNARMHDVRDGLVAVAAVEALGGER